MAQNSVSEEEAILVAKTVAANQRGGCNNTQHLDTNILNEWIDSGTLEMHLEHATITL